MKIDTPHKGFAKACFQLVKVDRVVPVYGGENNLVNAIIQHQLVPSAPCFLKDKASGHRELFTD